ncbi:MAG: hypothetical protein JRH17_09155 [Deltaproteobacteria bacterium]|nr:hypothetical protein [Deltaproteobacteria bacterium]MBW2696622.1 hypothetical protein [Deltaproteobacteria bacterium]
MTRATALIAALCLTLLGAGGALAAEGDLNSDGVVDQSDLQILQDSMGSGQGDENFVPGADLDGDGLISVVDLADLHRLILAN